MRVKGLLDHITSVAKAHRAVYPDIISDIGGGVMASDVDVQAVLDCHRATSHSVESVQANNRTLDFSNLPRT